MYTHEYVERGAVRPPTKPVFLPALKCDLYRLMELYLTSRNLSYCIALDNGWYPTTDYAGTPRVVIPASSKVNSWPYYQARAIVGCPEHIKRYVSPSAPRGDALAVVFPEGVAHGSVVVEGPMDALAAAGAGYVGIGLMGNTPNDAVLDHIEKVVEVYGKCYVIPDRDAFQEGTEIITRLWSRGVRCTLKSVVGGKDLAELSPKQREALLGP